MGLRCLLGHDFADPEIEREREEEGEEMVVTVREVKTCTRCGHTRIISENKEVTSIRPASEVTGFEDGEGETTATEPERQAEVPNAEESEWSEPNPHPATEGIADETATVDSSFGADTESFEADVESVEADAESFDPPQSAEEDDGIILDEEEEPAERQPGEWPDADEVDRGDGRMPTLEEVETELDAGESESRAWPAQEGEDEGFAADPPAADEGDVEVDFGDKLAPELSEDDTVEAGYDAEFIGNAEDEPTDRTGGSSGGFTRAETLSRTDASELPTEYFCPACEMTRDADQSSMRAGDICPECKHGYITERER
ncbi:hypothetical protein SAMN04487948_10332 [Halogranum amylolyticum]|uniref:Uncharacterized protein n=1 Tax=Halogranum amylolyticum TaxID=660520 RepID=A0A1H8QCP9_9EURY|nr:hypothetical protein [Halogranum amylolyticum]SEO51771.1 hypothetical protein SAMN04487948_10332 [Halogranum amylolyticum]